MSLDAKITDLVTQARQHKQEMKIDGKVTHKEEIQESAPRPYNDF